ncbi:MAG: MBL fold metallo-hydrolase [Halanaerobiales bacterium]
MKLKNIKGNIFYIPQTVNIGIINTEKGVILIDSGLDETIAARILNTLENSGFYPTAIINTHSHADHCGGNHYLQKNTGCEVYAPILEAGVIRRPYLEPFYLFSGAAPINSLVNKYLKAEPSRVDVTFNCKNKELIVNDKILKVIPLRGHSPEQIGIGIGDVFFCADSLFAPQVLKKHKIPFHADIKAQLQTLDLLEGLDYSYYLPAHGNLMEDITNIIKINRETIKDILSYIEKLLSTARSTENLLREVFTHYQIKIKDEQMYYLLKTAVMAYISYLYNEDKIKSEFRDNIIHWVAK